MNPIIKRITHAVFAIVILGMFVCPAVATDKADYVFKNGATIPSTQRILPLRPLRSRANSFPTLGATTAYSRSSATRRRSSI